MPTHLPLHLSAFAGRVGYARRAVRYRLAMWLNAYVSDGHRVPRLVYYWADLVLDEYGQRVRALDKVLSEGWEYLVLPEGSYAAYLRAQAALHDGPYLIPEGDEFYEAVLNHLVDSGSDNLVAAVTAVWNRGLRPQPGVF